MRDLGEQLVGSPLLGFNALENRNIIGEVEDLRPAAESAVDCDFVVLNLLSGTDKRYVADLRLGDILDGV